LSCINFEPTFFSFEIDVDIIVLFATFCLHVSILESIPLNPNATHAMAKKKNLNVNK
jgi:hypothetical protein